MAMLTGWLEHIGLGAIFALVLVEQIGLPLPSYPLLIVAGAWSARGGAPVGQITFVAVSAAVIADTLWYGAGRRFGTRVLRTMCKITLEPDSCVSDTERAFGRFGTRVLLFAKFVPGLGAVATAMSGVVAAPILSFATFDVLGSLLWAASGVLLGAVFHDAVEDVFAVLGRFGHAGLALIVLLVCAFIGYKYWRRHQFFMELRMARITVDELSRLLEQDARPTIVDARSEGSRIIDGMIPGAIPFERLADADRAVMLDGEVVVYCACPNEATAARVAKRLLALGFVRVRPLAGGIHAWQDAGFSVQFP